MKFAHGTAIYTGGGCYIVIGETDKKGTYFYGCTDFCEIMTLDPRTKNEYGDLICMYTEEIEPYVIETDRDETWRIFEDFCTRLDNEEPNITDGYEDFSNYCAGEVARLIDFSDYNH